MIQTDYLILPRKADLMLINTHKKRTSYLQDFAIPVDRRMKLKCSTDARRLRAISLAAVFPRCDVVDVGWKMPKSQAGFTR